MLAVAGAACGPSPVAQRPWALDIPDGLPSHDYAAVSAADREGNHIRLVEDLVVDAETDPMASFYTVGDAAADSRGRIFVVDSRESHVKVFDAEGVHVATLGRPGEGPGEFQQPRSTVVGPDDGLYVLSSRDRRVSVWSPELQHVEDIRASSPIMQLMRVRADGSLLVAGYEFDPGAAAEESNMRTYVAVMARSGELGERLIDVDAQNIPTFVRDGSQTYYSMNPRPHPAYRVRQGGGLFFSPGGEYQVVAYDEDGRHDWALRAPVVPEPVPEEIVDRVFELALERTPDLARGELIIADQLPVIEALNVDGAGRLYVYPYVSQDYQNPPARVPVDVYAPDGTRIFTGTIDHGRWSDARGGYLYSPSIDPDTQEHRVVRWRLAAPWTEE